MSKIRVIAGALCCCLLLSLAGCGNKGPLELPDQQAEEDERQKTRDY
jgi:predicted small lipoprotein YifL